MSERMTPPRWRIFFTMSTLPVNWICADREEELMTEAEFRIYQKDVREANGR